MMYAGRGKGRKLASMQESGGMVEENVTRDPNSSMHLEASTQHLM